jgi:hypothetical protein
MKNGKATGPDEIPAEVWKCLGNEGICNFVFYVNCLEKYMYRTGHQTSGETVSLYPYIRKKETYSTMETTEV